MSNVFKNNIINVLMTLVLIFIIITIIGIIYTRPSNYSKVFNDVILTSDLSTISGRSTIEINAKITKRVSFKNFNGEKILDGKIKIDNKEYSLFAYNLGEATNNAFFGDVKENPADSAPKYVLYMFDNLDSIYLSGYDKKEYLAAPAKSIDEFEHIRSKINRKK